VMAVSIIAGIKSVGAVGTSSAVQVVGRGILRVDVGTIQIESTN
jgi:hypothetical protein